jgi:AcrR family transcriptional regulator
MGRKKKLENQSELIIEAARQLFSQFGFAKTTLDDIAREVGIGKATLYSDFSSKDDILQAVIHKNQQQALENMRAVIKKSKFGPLKTLHELLLQDVMFTYAQMKRHFQDTDPSRPPILQGGRIVSTAPYQVTMDEKARIMAELLDQAIRDGLIEPMPDTVVQARIFRLGLMGVKPLVMTGYKDHEVHQHISNLIDILLSGLKFPRNKLDEPLGKQ